MNVFVDPYMGLIDIPSSFNIGGFHQPKNTSLKQYRKKRNSKNKMARKSRKANRR